MQPVGRAEHKRVRRQREMDQIGKQPGVRGALADGRAAILNAISAAARDRH
jgi:hypothetical protein